MTDFALDIFNAIAAMKDYAPLQYDVSTNPNGVKPAGFIFDTNSGAPEAKVIRRGLAEYPQIRGSFSGEASIQTAPRTFAMNATNYSSATCDVPRPKTFTFEIILIHAGRLLGAQSALEAGVRSFLESKHPTLGIARVADFGVRGGRKDENNDVTANVLRTVTRLTLTVNARPYLSQLTP